MRGRGQNRLGRRDLLRWMGVGTAAALAPTPLRAETSGQGPGPETPGCWDAVNDEQPQARKLRGKGMGWWRNAKFGMFIHWGPCSLASVEISWPIMEPDPKWNITQDEYVNLYKKFNPVKYDPDHWVGLAKAAGQRYMVFTSKHHDGFCMFDSSFTDYKIANTPYKKDIVQMLGEACRRQAMPLGFYYSPPDMHHPAFRDTSKPASENWHGQPTRPEWPLYLNYMDLQVRELLCRYGPVAVVWFDGLDDQEKYDGYSTVRMLRELSPGTLVNNRIGVPGDFETPEQWVPKRIPVKGVRITGVNAEEAATLPGGLPQPGEFKPWETCMTINDTWAYNKNDRNFKSTKFLIQTLVDVASKGGNFLLNVGPTPEGTIQPEFEERLRGIGEWLKVNGDSIYGTNYGPLQDLAYGRTTTRDRTVYLHVFEWPRGKKLEVPGPPPFSSRFALALPARVQEVTLLANGQPLPFKQNGWRLTIEVPAQPPDDRVTVIAITS